MITDNIDNIWNSASNTVTDTEEPLQLVRKERTKDVRRKIRMSIFGFNLSLATVVALWATVSGKSQLPDSWPALVCLIILWATYLEFIRYRISQSSCDKLKSHDLRTAFQLTLEKARTSLREIQILLAVNLLTIIPMTIVSVQTLLDNGKMTTQQGLGFTIFCLLIFGANIAFLLIQYFSTIRPQCALLQKRIESLEA
ncbi:MAG: hypothetical protein O3C43_23385 [Verrucomicrobia bacterium]|nr:hypothetical protein [Verrucomicrobiota bacterium]